MKKTPCPMIEEQAELKSPEEELFEEAKEEEPPKAEEDQTMQITFDDPAFIAFMNKYMSFLGLFPNGKFNDYLNLYMTGL